MVRKQLLVPDRVRRPPGEGFSWVDRRFVREHAPDLGRDAILLYFFLAAVSDRDGLSYWKDSTAAGRLGLDIEALARARAELVARDLVAHLPPLTQVLSLPDGRYRETRGDHRHGPQQVGDILRRILGRPR